MTAIRRLAAILAADVAGYSRLMGADEEGTHERLKAHFRELFDPKIAEHRGRIVKNTGDELCSRSLRVLWMRLSSLQLAAGNHVMAHRCRERGPSTPSSAPDSALERMGFEPVWGFSCQVVFWFVGGSLFGARKSFFVPSPAIRFVERAEGVKGPKR